jgi:hypothetical protein
MPTRDHPFTTARSGDMPRPYLPVTIVNPAAVKRLSIIALIAGETVVI